MLDMLINSYMCPLRIRLLKAAYSHKLTVDLKDIILHASTIFWILVLELLLFVVEL